MSSPPFDADKYKALMSGLECSEVNFSQVIYNSRIDSEYYKQVYINCEEVIASLANKRMGDLVDVLTDFHANGSYKSISENYEMLDTPDYAYMVRTVDLERKDFFGDVKYVSKKTYDFLGKSKLYGGEILINKIGSPGRTYYMPHLPSKMTLGMNLFLARCNDKCTNEYLYAYLNCSFGRKLIQRFVNGTVPLSIDKASIRNIIVPVFSMKLYKQISRLILISESLYKSHIESYDLAQHILSHELGLDNWQPSKEKISVRSVAEVEQAGRWDAEYYQPKYDEILTLAQDVPNKRLGSIVTIDKSIEPGSSAYQDEGIPFLRVQDLTIHGFGETEIHLDPIAFRDAPRVKADTILLTKDGTVGIAYKVEQDEDAITSGAILHLHLNDNDINPDYLTLVLNSPVVKLQAEQDAGGSVIQHWKPSEIEKVVIPLLPYAIQEKISNKVQDAFKLRHQSQHLLHVAKRAVEIAIEEDEDAALTYLSSQTDTFTDEEYSIDVSQQSLKVAEPEVGDNTNIDKGLKADERT